MIKNAEFKVFKKSRTYLNLKQSFFKSISMRLKQS